MDLSKFGLFKLMSRKMDWLTQRQEVLAKNIANADTPEFKPRDMKPFTFRDALNDTRRMDMKLTEAGHLKGSVPTEKDGSRRQRNTYETAPNGNAVIVEEQVMKVGETTMDYNTVLNLYRKQVAMIRTAMRSGGG